ncbi:hypothetical protein AGOR_G00093600 [Albula goreensis]|uniref:Carbonic anhydrase n=1 Tax=Albula goreensis TaxID=1534307 RepID=A0A8T3DGB3_9TELE|nr:hypothetical protein AGOR_G00093600 [Albula goreensis]
MGPFSFGVHECSGIYGVLTPNNKMILTFLLESLCFSICFIIVTGSSQSGAHTSTIQRSNDPAHDWCYQGCDFTPSHWKDLPNVQCGGHAQSPISIDTSHLTADPSLVDFNFTNFSNNHTLKYFINTGHTVKCVLEENMVEIEGGGLNHKYSTLQFHFHWGDKLSHPGSEHLINDDRYPMEMHIVSLKKGLSVEEAMADPEGIAVLGFFIDVREEDGPEGWKTLTSYLTNITAVGSEVDISHSITIDDLLGNVSRSKFYRYHGSLTTPPCSEAVVWTVFQEPIPISEDVVKLFPKTLNHLKLYRPKQDLNGRKVFASPAILPPPGHSWCYDEHCDYKPSRWYQLPHSHCGGDRQSPINIDTNQVMHNKDLNNFTFVNFSNEHSMKYLKNTGHTVKCVLEENMVEIEGGGLNHKYSTLQFHFHWGGEDEHSSGSEHTVNSKRYQMEMHIVSLRKGLTVEQAKVDPEGIAVLGFFIEGTDDGHHQASWEYLTSYLTNIKHEDSIVNITHKISMDDLLGDVDRSKYYRYKGSLTTPDCNEAVVWTLFKTPIKVKKDLLKKFPTMMGYHNVYRPKQELHKRTIYTSSAPTLPSPTALLVLLPLFYPACGGMGAQ